MFTVSMGVSPLCRAYLWQITRLSGRHDVGVTALDDIAGMASTIYWTDMARNDSLVDRICVFFSDKLF